MFNQIELPIAPSWRYTFALLAVLIAGLVLQYDVVPTPYFEIMSAVQCILAAVYVHRYTLLSSDKSVGKLVVNPESKTLDLVRNNGEKVKVAGFDTVWITGNLVLLTLRIESSKKRQQTIPLFLNIKTSTQIPSSRRLKVLLKHNYFKD